MSVLVGGTKIRGNSSVSMGLGKAVSIARRCNVRPGVCSIVVVKSTDKRAKSRFPRCTTDGKKILTCAGGITVEVTPCRTAYGDLSFNKIVARLGQPIVRSRGL